MTHAPTSISPHVVTAIAAATQAFETPKEARLPSSQPRFNSARAGLLYSAIVVELGACSMRAAHTVYVQYTASLPSIVQLKAKRIYEEHLGDMGREKANIGTARRVDSRGRARCGLQPRIQTADRSTLHVACGEEPAQICADPHCRDQRNM